MVENDEFRLTVEVGAEIEISLYFQSNVVVSEDLRVVSKQNFVDIFIIKFNFTSYCAQLRRQDSNVLKQEVLVFQILFIYDKVLDVVLVIL